MPTPFQTLHKRYEQEAKEAAAKKPAATRRKRRSTPTSPATEDRDGAEAPAPTGEEGDS